GVDRLGQLLLPGLAPEALALEVGLEAGDGVLLLPALEELGGLVALGVVGGGVGAHAEGDGIDERRAAAGDRALAGLAGGLVDGEDVVPVDADAGHAVGDRLVGEGCGGGLRLLGG